MEEVYTKFRKEFIQWSIGRFRITETDAIDHYQDAMMLFFEKAMAGNVTELQSGMKTFIFGIGKNRILIMIMMITF